MEEEPGFSSRQVQKIFLFPIMSRPAVWPTQHAIQVVPWAISPGLKRQGCEADRSTLSSAEVKNGGAILPIRLKSS
jgi:hypothetical protein